MAKVSIKSEKITPFGGIFHVRDHFSRFVGPVIDKVLGHRCKSFGYQSARLWVLCLVSTSVAATVWMMWRPIWCPISRFIPLFANAALTQFSGESLSWAAPTRGVFCHGWIELTSTNSRKWAYRQIFLQLRKNISFFICTFAPDLTKIHCRLRSAKSSNEFGSLLSLARQFAWSE